MTQQPVTSTLSRIIAEHFGLEPGTITADTAMAEIPRLDEWNPITHVGLLIRLEEVFGVQLDEGAGFLAGSVKELAAAIEQAQARSTP